MKFLVDAQLPRRLARLIHQAGHDSIHTLDLPKGNRTSDSEILSIAEREDRVVVTKDADFVNSFLLDRRPPKLLLVSTGNIINRDLDALIADHLPDVVRALDQNAFVELGRTCLRVHA